MKTARTLAVAAALTLLPGVAAWAHPSLNGEGEPGEPTELNLVVPHGCSASDGMPIGDEEAFATIELAVQLVEGVAMEPLAVDGWTISVADGVVSWFDDGGATTEVIEFPVVVTIDGEAGDVFELPAVQECEDDTSIRWNTEEFPPVRVVAAGGDTTAAEDGHGDHDTGDVADHATEDMTDHATEDMTSEDHGMELGDVHMVDDAGGQALAGETADGSAWAIVFGALALVVVLLAAGLFARRRGQA